MTLPEVLAGPILRRTEGQGVCVWLATSAARTVRVVVGRSRADDLEALGQARATSVRLGPGLHIHLAHVAPEAGAFPTDELLAYDVVLEGDGPARRLADLGLLDGPGRIAYTDLALPTFFVRGPATPRLNLTHGSCRLLHGKGQDATLALDELLAATAGDLAKRPSGLFLTGDQVYVDEVAGPLIGHLTGLGAALLGPEDDTSVPGVPDLSDIPVYGRQDLATERARFTSGKAANHLFSLGELAAAYLVAWAEVNWPARWPEPGDALDDRLRTQYEAERECLDTARLAMPAMRRVLANVPTYTCFDDHDVTDDWNLTRGWQERVRSSPTGRRVVANALAAFWAFQGWGNQPEAFDASFVETVAAGPRAAGDRFDELLWSFDQWSYVAPTDPPTIVLDTRTRRTFDSDEGAARLIGADETDRVRRLVTGTGVSAPGPILLVSAVPMFGLELQERRQKFLVGRLGPYEIDFEAWHSNLAGFVAFMRALVEDLGLRRCVVLSGDVHYGLNVEATFRAGEAELSVAQLISSSFKHSGTREKSALHLLGRLVRGGHERVGWDRPPDLTEPHGFAGRLLRRSVNTDEWADDAPVFLPRALEGRVEADPGPRYLERRRYVDPEERPGWFVVGENNVGHLSLDDDGLVHRLLARTDRHQSTAHTARFRWEG